MWYFREWISLGIIIALLGGPAVAQHDADEGAIWTETQIERLSLEEKVSQLFTAWIDGRYQSKDAPEYREMVDLVENFGIGGIIFGLGDPTEQASLANDLQRRADLPLLVSQDMEWGPAMRIDRASSFPPAMAVGASRDATYAFLQGYATAREARALGVHQVYAPVADVNNNPANPIINIRSFGETPELASEMAAAYTRGVQQGGTLGTVKHFPGHGDTDVDSHLDLPVLRLERDRLSQIELPPFRAALDAGVSSVMTGHLAFPTIEPDSTLPASLSPRVTNDLLRGEMGFDGLVVTDALNMHGVTDFFGAGEAAVRALEAGADVLLMSEDPYVARAAILDAIEEGRLTEERITASVRRILQAKERLDLHHQRAVDLNAVSEVVKSRPHEVIDGAMARAGITVLNNRDDLLPLTPPAQRDVLVVRISDREDSGSGGPFVNAVRQGAGVASVTTRRLDPRSDAEDRADILDEVDAYDIVLVPTFTRVEAFAGDIGLNEENHEFLSDLVQASVPVGLVAFGNPYVSQGIEPQPAAVVTGYGSGDELQRVAAQTLLGESGASARLPITIPDTYEFGTGLDLEQVAPRRDHPESVGMEHERLARVDSLLQEGVMDRAFPGAAFAVGRESTVAALDGVGHHTYDAKTPATPSSVYDVASLTKVVALTTAAMLLYEEGELDLDAQVVEYLPDFGQEGKEEVTVRQLLSHSSGLKPYLPPEQRGDTREAIIDTVMAEPLQYEPGTESRYSGLGIITLTHIIESITEQDFDAYAEEHIFRPLGMADTGFRPVGEVDESVVPTTDTTDALFQGTVHDPIARAMGGVSGNAGLFSTAEDLTRFAHMLVNDGAIYGEQFLEPETIDRFTSHAGVGEESTRALGWDTKDPEADYTSAGDRFSPNSFGHTGYTGTSMWIDPDENLYAILLTNRVYPDDTDQQITDIRPRVADFAHEAMVDAPEPMLPQIPHVLLGEGLHPMPPQIPDATSRATSDLVP